MRRIGIMRRGGGSKKASLPSIVKGRGARLGAAAVAGGGGANAGLSRSARSRLGLRAEPTPLEPAAALGLLDEPALRALRLRSASARFFSDDPSESSLASSSARASSPLALE